MIVCAGRPCSLNVVHCFISCNSGKVTSVKPGRERVRFVTEFILSARILCALSLAGVLVACGGSGTGDLLVEVTSLDARNVDIHEIHEQHLDAAVCVPNCDKKQCGHDGCGGSCGTCPCETCLAEETQCLEFSCVVPPTCFDIFFCLQDCTASDQDCQIVCLQQAPHDEQVKFDSYYDCFLQGKLPLPDECFAEHCPDWANTDSCSGKELLECISPGENECEEAAFACFPPQEWL